jgi:hypothetical protein
LNHTNILTIHEIGFAAGRHFIATEFVEGQSLRDRMIRTEMNIEEASDVAAQEYFGYLRRNPNDPNDTDYIGYDFWLTKLNEFNGHYINAEMVKALISSGE